MGVLGVGFSEAPAGCSDSVVRDSIFMVTELCRGGSLREKVLEQMIAGRKVLETPLNSTPPHQLTERSWLSTLVVCIVFLHVGCCQVSGASGAVSTAAHACQTNFFAHTQDTLKAVGRLHLQVHVPHD